jgi:CBS domain-containing protein
MTNRKLLSIVKDQDPLVMDEGQSVEAACAAMCQRHAGSVLVVDRARRLAGIFTGRDAVRMMAKGGDAARVSLSLAMTEEPVTISPRARAIDALRLMADGGFRHLPVVEDGRIWGVVSRGDFLGAEIDRVDIDEHLAECIW